MEKSCNDEVFYVLERNPRFGAPIHLNPEFEFLVVKKGSVEVFYRDQTYKVDEGHAFAIPPYQVHGFGISEASVATVYMFSYAVCEDYILNFTNGNLQNNIFYCKKELRDYLDFLSSNKQRNVFVCKAMFYALASEFIKDNCILQDKIHSDNIVLEISTYITKHISDKITLQDISSSMGINKRKMCSVFKEQYGISILDFIHNIRLEKAAMLIESSGLAITQIADLCGFESIRNFNRVFVDKMSCTPSEYRKKAFEKRHKGVM